MPAMSPSAMSASGGSMVLTAAKHHCVTRMRPWKSEGISFPARQYSFQSRLELSAALTAKMHGSLGGGPAAGGRVPRPLHPLLLAEPTRVHRFRVARTHPPCADGERSIPARDRQVQCGPEVRVWSQFVLVGTLLVTARQLPAVRLDRRHLVPVDRRQAGTVKPETCEKCRGYVKIQYQVKDPTLEAVVNDVAHHPWPRYADGRRGLEARRAEPVPAVLLRADRP